VGDLNLFVVAFGPDREGMLFEAIFT